MLISIMSIMLSLAQENKPVSFEMINIEYKRCQEGDPLVQATLLMDLHAHLSSSEVIGLLGGTWDAAGRRVAVARAFPCRHAPGSQSGTSVELDPSAEVETRALMAAEDLTPVGW